MLATQTLPQMRPKTMAVESTATLPPGVTAKDIVLAIIGAHRHRRRHGPRHRVPGPAIRALSMEGRMTMCNMSIEAGARAGMIAPDDTTFAYLEGRPHAPDRRGVGAALDDWRTPRHRRRRRASTRRSSIDASAIRPTSPGAPTPPRSSRSTGRSPTPSSFADAGEREAAARALRVHGAHGGDADARRSRSTPSSSGRAPTRASRTSGPPPRCSTAATSARACGPSSCPARTA